MSMATGPEGPHTHLRCTQVGSKHIADCVGDTVTSSFATVYKQVEQGTQGIS